jgi:hypothetical protein
MNDDVLWEHVVAAEKAMDQAQFAQRSSPE